MKSLTQEFLKAVELFNRGDYFECHELLEDLWRPAEGTVRDLLQGLIQIAVSLHHESRGNTTGARTLYERGRKRLTSLPVIEAKIVPGIEIDRLLDQTDRFFEAATDERVAPQISLRLHNPLN